MDQQAVDVAVECRASSNHADVRFLRLKEVLAICGKSRSSVYDAIRKGDFPKPVMLSGRFVRTDSLASLVKMLFLMQGPFIPDRASLQMDDTNMGSWPPCRQA